MAGVWRDYARQNGSVLIQREVYVSLTGDGGASDAGLWLEPGVAPDEMTAVWIKSDRTFEVLGDSNVVVLDAAGERPAPVAAGTKQRARGVRLHVLVAGDAFDLLRRTPIDRSGGPVEAMPRR